MELNDLGFNARITDLEQEFSAFRREFNEHRNDQQKEQVEHLETQTTAVSDVSTLREVRIPIQHCMLTC